MSIKKLLDKKRILVPFLILTVILIIAGKLFLDAIYVPVIVMYHSVGKKSSALDGYGPKLNVSTEAFQKQMKFLRERDYKVIPLTEFINRIKKKEKLPRKTIAITFDDGLKNNFTDAYPILKKYNLPATIFVSTDFIGEEKFLTWNDIRIMQDNQITIGSHTMSHKWLPSLTKSDIYEELSVSRKILERMTGRNIEVLSYPLGGFDEAVKEQAKNAGYIGAVTTNPGRKYPKNDIYALKRVRISMTSNNLLTFWIETSGYYTFIKEIRDED